MLLKGHVLIEGSIKCLTGLHIGAEAESIEIGGIDSPIIRNPITREPYIPGSSLKGKMRSFLERCTNKPDNRDGGAGIKRHECDKREEAISCEVCRLFGSTGKGEDGSNHPALLLVRDGLLKNRDFLLKDGLIITEAKMENTLDRVTAAANPRTIERVPAGAEFNFELIYRVYDYSEKYFGNDLVNIVDIFANIEKDGIGGHISRGYGKVKFHVARLEGMRIDGSSAGGCISVKDKEYLFEECEACIDQIKF